jgi:hypothetical protein
MNMISNVKLNKKAAKSTAQVKNTGKMQPLDGKVSKDMSISQKEAVVKTALDIETQNPDLNDAMDEYLGNELYTLRYDINEKGIGKILLPPSLSTLLQSDRVCISPTAGGLFIKSL